MQIYISKYQFYINLYDIYFHIYIYIYVKKIKIIIEQVNTSYIVNKFDNFIIILKNFFLKKVFNFFFFKNNQF